MAYDNTLANPVTGTTISTTGWGNKVVGNIQTLAKRSIVIEVFSPTTDVATGDGKKYFHIPSPLTSCNLVEVHAFVVTAGVTGTTDIQIHNVTDNTDMLSTKLTIDSGETGSDTAAAAAVIDATKDDVVTNDVIRIDVDAISSGTAPKGLYVTLTFSPI